MSRRPPANATSIGVSPSYSQWIALSSRAGHEKN